MKPRTRLLQGIRSGLLMSATPEGEPVAVPPVPETPAPEIKQVDLPAAPAAAAPSVPEVKPAAAPAPPKKDWKEERIAALTAKASKKDEEIERLRGELAAATAGNPDLVPKSEVEKLAAAKAAEDGAAAKWNDDMNAMIRQGREAFPDEFNASVAAVRSMVDPKDPREVVQYRTLLAAAHETGQGHLVINALGKDPGKLQELLAEPTMKMTVAVARLAGELSKPAEPSAAPKPITPIASSGIHYEAIKPDDKENGAKLPIKEWMERREKQARAANIQ